MRDFLSKLLFIYTTVVFVFTVIYIIDPQLFFDIRSVFTMGNTKINFHSRTYNRFTFIYSDPNNAGCALTGVYAYVLFCEKNKLWKNLYYIITLTAAIAMTMSIQSIVAFVCVTLAFLWIPARKSQTAKRAFLIIFGVLAVGGIFIWQFFLKDSDVIVALMKRGLSPPQ